MYNTSTRTMASVEQMENAYLKISLILLSIDFELFV